MLTVATQALISDKHCIRTFDFARITGSNLAWSKSQSSAVGLVHQEKLSSRSSTVGCLACATFDCTSILL